MTKGGLQDEKDSLTDAGEIIERPKDSLGTVINAGPAEYFGDAYPEVRVCFFPVFEIRPVVVLIDRADDSEQFLILKDTLQYLADLVPPVVITSMSACARPKISVFFIGWFLWTR